MGAAAWKTFATAQGTCGVAWGERGVTAFCLPQSEAAAVEQQLRLRTGAARPAGAPPAWVRQLIQAVKAHLKGDLQDFSQVPLQFDGSSFLQSVFRAAQQIPAGSVLTYGELAAAIGKPGASRAIGAAMGRNPIPLLIPCHRVVAAGGKPGGFSAPGGLDTKLALLDCEGVALRPPPVLQSAAQWRRAVAALARQDKAMARLIRRVGAFDFTPHQREEPLTALIAAITSQQLSTRAAATILGRVNALIAPGDAPDPHLLLAIPDAELRGAGLSFMKISFLKDLARRYLAGELPGLERIRLMSDRQVIDSFTRIRGVGQWTVEMYLIFNLGRADVFPALDLGVRKGLAQVLALPALPDAETAAQLGARWAPLRSVAALYLWRSLDNQPAV